MKKYGRLLLTALLLLSMLLGCGKTEPAEKTDVPQQIGQPESIAPPEDTVSPDQPEKPEVKPLPGLLTNREALDAAGILWYIPNELLETEQYQELYIMGETLLMTRLAYSGDPYGEGASCTLYLATVSIETGTLLQETELPGVVSGFVQVCGETVVISDRETGRLILLDSDLNLISEHTLDPDWNSVHLNSDATVLYALTGESGICTEVLATGERSWQEEHLRDVYMTAQNGNQISFSCVDLSTQFTSFGVLDLSSGEITFFPFDGTYFGASCCRDVWLAYVPGEERVFMVGTEEEASCLRLDTAMLRLQPAGNEVHLLASRVSSTGDLSMALYRTDGTFLSSAAQPMFRNAYCTPPVWSDRCGGYFFTVTGYDGKTQLLFWDLSVPMQGENLTSASAEADHPEAGTAVAAELYAQAAELSEKYGVTVRIADQCDTEYLTYAAELNTDPDTISYALALLDDTLSDYPDGFLEQLLHGSYREIEINLNGALTPWGVPDDANGFTSFIGFVEQQDDKTVMVLDIREGLAIRQHIYHEMSHIIDQKLLFDSHYREDALYSEEAWAALNPDGFDYTLDYYNLPDDIYWDGYDSWFIDTYARTYPSEDRARILEYAMLGHTYPFADGSPLREKLEFYSECIRDCFDTTGWPDETLWEAAMN